MSWNYRVTRTKEKDGTLIFGIREVYYTGDTPDSWTERIVAPLGTSFKEFTDAFALYSKAFQRPMLAIEANHTELYELSPLGTGKGKLVWKKSREKK